MDEYTIYCTPEQTRRALELGAPIKRALYPSTWFEELHPKRCHIDIPENPNGCTLAIPTAEQMCGWLEEQGISISIEYNTSNLYSVSLEGLFGYIPLGLDSREKTTLAAIDAALEYLVNNRK